LDGKKPVKKRVAEKIHNTANSKYPLQTRGTKEKEKKAHTGEV
jgi:hypothetical protein